MFYVLNLIAAMHERIQRIEDKDRGATATEYAMLVAFIAIIISVGVGVFGTALDTWFSNLGNRIGLNK
jgi:pilus assembly protein Flp/PilA